ncbi:MAG: acyl carrier protein [Eubacteriales bacterium]|nr:acyl carrier protein [Eubacteriales bacterium]
MERLMEVLERALPNVDWSTGQDLVDDGIIDSIDVVTLISELTDEYDIEISSDEMEPENFNSAEAILNMIERLMEE